MSPIQLQSTVGDDGHVTRRVNVGDSEANLPVRLTIEPLAPQSGLPNGEKMPWRELIDKTCGSCAELGIEPDGK